MECKDACTYCGFTVICFMNHNDYVNFYNGITNSISEKIIFKDLPYIKYPSDH